MNIIDTLSEFREKALKAIETDSKDDQSYLLLVLALDACKRALKNNQVGPAMLLLEGMVSYPSHRDCHIVASLKVDKESGEKEVLLSYVSPEERAVDIPGAYIFDQEGECKDCKKTRNLNSYDLCPDCDEKRIQKLLTCMTPEQIHNLAKRQAEVEAAKRRKDTSIN